MICKKCGIEKEEDEFRPYSKYGKQYRYKQCRACEYLYFKNRRINEREKVREIYNRSISKHKERVSAYMKKYKETHPEFVKKLNEYKKAYRSRDDVKARKVILQNNRRTILLGLSPLPKTLWKSILDFYGNKCLRCNRSDVKLTIDHIVPLKLGGTNDVDNLQPLCKSCNSKKHLKVVDYRNGIIYNGV